MIGRFDVHPDVAARFPGFRASVLIVRGVLNAASTPASRDWLRAGAERGLAALGGRPPRDHPSLRAWRDAYSAFGAKPSAYPCSAEALLQRALKGGADSVPAINLLVDAYNAVSLAYLLPIGGEDSDRTVGRYELRFATEDDSVPGEDFADAPRPGEVIWADEAGWTCRRWNWRQGSRTRLTESTGSAFFLIEGMASRSFEPDIGGATRELSERIRTHCSPEAIEVEVLVGA